MTDTIRIPLGPSGKPVAWTVVDASDYERLIIHRWYLSGRGYAFRSDGESVFMHRQVLGFPDAEDINHINGDQLDNRRANLEACSHAQNMRAGANAKAWPMLEEICALRLEGWPNREIANELGISVASVVRYASHLPKAPNPNTKWTREDLIDAVQRFHNTHGRIPAVSELDGQDGMPWYTTVYRRFPGGFRELREAAGFGGVDLRKRVAA